MKTEIEDVDGKLHRDEIDACIAVLDKFLEQPELIFELPEERRIALLKLRAS